MSTNDMDRSFVYSMSEFPWLATIVVGIIGISIGGSLKTSIAERAEAKAKQAQAEIKLVSVKEQIAGKQLELDGLVDVKRERDKALSAAKIAAAATASAEKKRDKARSAAQIAEEATARAEKERDKARSVETIAEVAKASAEKERDEARRATQIAEEATARAERERDDSDERLGDARKKITELEIRIEDLVEREGHIPKELLRLKGRLERVAIIFDRSRSMANGGRWEDARAVVETWLRYLPIDECSLIVFNDSVQVHPDIPEDHFWKVSHEDPEGRGNRDLLIGLLKEIKPEGGTNTLGALRAAYQLERLDTIILFTDGQPTGPMNVLDLIYEEISESRKIPINTVGLGDYFEKPFADFLIRLANDTGGVFIGR